MNSAPATAPAEAPQDLITNYAAYVGGAHGAANPHKSPIVIGWFNQQGGPTDIDPNGNPTKGAQLGVNYVNQQLGGIDGHPLKLVTCFTSTAESQGQQCGEQFLNDKPMVAALIGADALGDQSFHRTINGAIPTVAGVSSNPADGVAKNSYILYGDQTEVLAPTGTYARDVLHAKTAAVVYPEVAGLTQGAQSMAASLQAAGLQVKKVGVSPSATDLIAPLTAAGVQSTDLVAPLPDPTTCVNIAKALTQLGYHGHVVSVPTCLSPIVSGSLGDFPKWDYSIATSLVGDTTDPSTKLYVQQLAQTGLSKLAPDVWPMMAFGQVITLAKFMNEIGAGNVSRSTLAAKVAKFKGPMVMGAPTIACGKNPKIPAACSFSTQFFHYEGKGKFVRASGWLGPPK